MHDDAIERRIALERAEAGRLALEEFARAIENRSGGLMYLRAWKVAARIARGMKPDAGIQANSHRI